MGTKVSRAVWPLSPCGVFVARGALAPPLIATTSAALPADSLHPMVRLQAWRLEKGRWLARQYCRGKESPV